MSLYAELKKRNVVRTAVTYLVIAWLLIQIGNVLFTTLELDTSANKLLFAILILGFIPALLFSWAYEITPEGIKHEKDLERNESYTNLTAKKLDILTIILVILAMIMFSLDRFTQVDLLHKPHASNQLLESNSDNNDLANSETTKLGIVDQIIDDRPSIAVLPFINMSANKENEYFSDGISEDILNALVRIDGLQVASRTSSFSFKDSMPDIPTVAKALKVNHIVEGSVRRSGDQVRITAQLIEVSTDKHLWSETYTRELKDVFAIQDEISAAIATALQLTLKSKSAARFTDSIEAYDIYLQGLAKMREANNPSRFDQAITLFDKALIIDEKFAEAQGGRCDAFTRKYRESKVISQVDFAIEACEQAIALNPEAPQVLVTQGDLYYERGQFELALKSFKKAIELQPYNATAYTGQAEVFEKLGDVTAAINSFEKSISLQPDISNTYSSFGSMLFFNGQLEDAAKNFLTSIKLNPNVSKDYSNLGGVYFYMGEFGKAAEIFKQSIAIAPNPDAYSNAGTNYYYQGEYEAAYAMFIESVKLQPSDSLFRGNLADSCRLLKACAAEAGEHYQQALDLVEEQLKVNKNDVTSLGQRALYLARLNRMKESQEQLVAVLKIGSKDPNTLYTAALIAAAKGDQKDTKKYALAAMQLGYPEAAVKADPDLNYLVDLK